jgi:hypothetical protein
LWSLGAQPRGCKVQEPLEREGVLIGKNVAFKLQKELFHQQDWVLGNKKW